MIVILSIVMMVLLMFISLATTSPSIKASYVFLALSLVIISFNHLLYYAMMIAVGTTKFSISMISISTVVYIGWTALILKKHKKSKTIK
jgi:drug/metabolite transporter (DMT)-like permease